MRPEATTTEVMAIYQELEALHAWRGWHWWPDADPFEVIVGCILVQNTAWTNVEHALDRLRAADALTPDAMTALPVEVLEEYVRPSGQYRQKAKKLRAFLALAERHAGLDSLLALPAAALRAELLATWGIGPESADAMVVYASRQPAFVIDAYTMRLFARLGVGPVASRDYATWQAFFTALVPEDRDTWARYHALIVMHSKHLCRKQAPKCGECTFAARCEFARAGLDG